MILQCCGSPKGAGLLNGYPCLILGFISVVNWAMAVRQHLLSVNIPVFFSKGALVPIRSLEGRAHWQYLLLFQIGVHVHGGAAVH